MRDLARFGLLYLRGGRWKDRQVLKPELVRLALSSPVPANLPRTTGKDAEMLPKQRTLGGGKDQAAAVLGISPTTADRDWALTRAWLRDAVCGS